MKPLDELTAAFECLWEAKRHAHASWERLEGEHRDRIKALWHEIGALRDKMEIELVSVEQATLAQGREGTR